MKNKKAQVGLDTILAIAGILGLFILIIWAAFYVLEQPTREDKCKTSCVSYDAEFVDYEPGGFTNSEECWCKRGNEPLRIW